jgi:uncharacterized protein
MSKEFSFPVLPAFRRPALQALLHRLRQPNRFLQVLAGPRQTGKTTLAFQAIRELGRPAHYVSADEPGLRGQGWIEGQWEAARSLVSPDRPSGGLLVLDEIQKLPGWSETVKRLWDDDRRRGRPLRVLILGSAQLLVQRGLTESLAGRFEVLRLPHWGFAEMREAFGWDLDRYLYFGGYPGAVSLIDDPPRWRQYILDSLVETTISRDVLLLTRVNKPALLRQLFRMGCEYSGQILSYQKMLGQLQDAGNTTTLAHYLELLAGAGMMMGLPKFSGSAVRRRGSTPKLLVLNTALMTAMSGIGWEEALGDRAFWGRLVESAVGAHLVNSSAEGGPGVAYWREGNREVDFVVFQRRRVLAIEVKDGRGEAPKAGLGAFVRTYPGSRTLMVGGDGLPVPKALATSSTALLGP